MKVVVTSEKGHGVAIGTLFECWAKVIIVSSKIIKSGIEVGRIPNKIFTVKINAQLQRRNNGTNQVKRSDITRKNTWK